MKKFIFIMIAVIAISVTGCKSSPPPSAEVKEVEWKLVEVRRGGDHDIKFDRNTLASEGFPDIFTMTFNNEKFSGKGALNTYTAAAAVGDKYDISVKPVNATQTADLTNPEKLREHDFSVYVQNMYKWKIVDEKLEIATKDENGKDVTLVFVK